MWRLTVSPLAPTSFLAGMLALAACGGSGNATGPRTGTLLVSTSTTGKSLDPDGYTFSVDGGRLTAIGLNATDTVAGLPVGNHEIQLAGIQANCSTAANESVMVVADAPTALAFGVTCQQAFVDKIAFVTDRDGQEEIYIMDPDGTHQVNVTNSPSADEQPAIAPDGEEIAFSTFRNGKHQLWVVSADSQQSYVTVDANDYDPSFIGASFGRWDYGGGLVFASDRAGHGSNLDVFGVDPSGGNFTQLTDDSLAYDGQPAWSPAVSKTAFTTNRDGNYEIYIMDADGGNAVNLTQSPSSDRYAAWSPDGSKIAFASDRAGTEDIWVMNADGSNPVRLTSGPGAEIYPSWSPDGSRIAFQGDHNGAPDIWVMNADGSNQVDLTNHPARDTRPFWSPVH